MSRSFTSHLRAAALALALALPSFASPPDQVPQGRLLAADGKHAEAAAAFEAYLKTNRFDGSAWSSLGFELHADKQYDRALVAFQKAVELGFAPNTQLYNMACAHALLGHKDEALSWLRLSLEARFADQQTLETDSDIDSLRDDPRFAQLTGITARLATPLAATREDGWRWDLDFLVRRMEQMHWDLYAKVTRETFRAEIDTLKADIPKLTDDQVRVRLHRIIALVGDGHTNLAAAPEGQTSISRYPLQMFIFEGGLYVLGADESHADLAGAKVLKIGSMDAAAAMDAVKPYISCDNEMHRLNVIPGRLINPVVLQMIGATKDDQGAEFTFAKRDGSQAVVTLAPAPFPTRRPPGIFFPGFKYAHEAAAAPLPLFLKNPDRRLWHEYLPDHKLVYFYFGAVQNPPQGSLRDTVGEVFETFDKNDAETLVIDMRFNGGGNTDLVQPLIHGLISRQKLARPGALYVIIGRATFSAAQNTVNMIEINTRATFVGEPTGSRPNFVGESTFFILPHSKQRVTCSSRYWQYASSIDQRTWVQPQIAAEPTIQSFLENRDPAMDAILARLKSTPSSTSTND